MFAVDLIKISRVTLELLSKSDIRIDDWRYLELYDRYKSMIEEGNKVSYVVALLSEEYGISEASVYRVIKRLGSPVRF